MAVKEELNRSIAIADVDLQETKLDTAQTLKTAKTKTEKSSSKDKKAESP